MEKKKGNCSSVKEYFLSNMGVSSLDAINEWFSRSSSNGYFVKNLKAAARLVAEFKNDPVYIFGDYDVDGACATSILYLGLTGLGFTDVHYRIPRRFSEGFGLNAQMVEEINPGERVLIITCDNGVASLEPIALAKKKGYTVVITDHHEPVVEGGKVVLPNADLIVDPNAIKQDGFTKWCGAGLAYKLICEMSGFSKETRAAYLPFAALATVCDCVDLKEENYVFVRQGLKLLSSPDCPLGLKKLISAFGIEEGSMLTETDLSFKLGPAINSASRLSDTGANKAVELLITKDETTSTVLADDLFCTNDRRKKIEAEVTAAALSTIEQEGLEGQCPLVVCVNNADEGVIGIVAGKLAEKFRTPTILVTQKEGTPGVLKGSARTYMYGGYNIKENLDAVSPLLITYGGHKSAGGLSLKEENLSDFREALLSNIGDYNVESPDTVWYDIEIPAEKCEDAFTELDRFAPWGEGNPRPTFKVVDFVPVKKQDSFIRIMGKNNDSFRISGKYADAVQFHTDTIPMISSSSPISLVGELNKNQHKGRTSLQINCKVVSM